jgi:cephalosporin hydroxylase
MSSFVPQRGRDPSRSRFIINDGIVAIGNLRLKLAPPEREWDAWRMKDSRQLLLDKRPELLEELDRLFQAKAFEARAIFELGIWDGASSLFWFEYFQPDKLVAVDILDREDDASFREYVQDQHLQQRLKTYWRTDQADRERLSAIASREFAAPLDLVIDDASHEFAATSASFETLFPLIRPGGLYLIEDWNWEVYPVFREPDHPWAEREGLVRLVKGLIDTAASGTMRLMVSQLYVAVERAR